jgi:hypothetical protein
LWQQTLPGVVQSVSALQSTSPSWAGSQLFGAFETRLVTTQASPICTLQVVSLVQSFGHAAADWHTLPAVP